MILIIQLCLLVSIDTILSKVIDVQFTRQNQTVLLFDKSSTKSDVNYQIIGSLPQKCALAFTLINNYTNVYLRYNHELATSSCLLELNHGITLNIDLMINKTLVLDLHSEQINELKLNVEYIFKVFNDSEYGLIYTDMKPNGIVSIVRLLYPKNDSIELRITSLQRYFQIKMFLSNFYMIRLSDNVEELYKQNDTIELGIEAILVQSGLSILTQTLKFKIIDKKNLELQFESSAEFRVTEKPGDSPNSGLYVTKLNPILKQNLFIDNTIKEAYLKNFIRMKIEASNIADDIFELDPVNGHLAIRAGVSLDREFWASKLKIDQIKFIINISLFDTNKLFRSNSIQICVNLIDSNDNEPRYPREEYDIDVNENQLDYFSSMLIDGQNFVLIFNQSAHDLDYGNNSDLNYLIVDVKLDNKPFNRELFYLEQFNGKLWLSTKIFDTINFFKLFNVKIMVKDNAVPEFKYSFVNLNVKIVKSLFDILNGHKIDLINKIDKKQNYYFEVDLDCLTQIGQLKIGFIYLKLVKGYFNIKLNENYSQFFNLTLGADGSLSLSLNENYIQNRQKLKRLNYIQTLFLYSNEDFETKAMEIFVQLNKQNSHQFDQNNYDLHLSENSNEKLIANLTSEQCMELSEARVIGFEKKWFNLISKKKSIELWTEQKLDAEIEQKIEFIIIAKCNRNNQDYLISTNVNVYIKDLNDNYPVFVNPPIDHFVLHKIISYSEIKKDQDILLMYIEALDADTSNSSIKYSLNSTSLKISSSCQELFNIILNLNKINGQLSVSNLYTESSFRHCQFYYQIQIWAFDSKNIQKLSLNVKIDLFGPDLVFYKKFNHNEKIYRIEFETIEFFQIEKCWVNGLDANYLMSYFLQQNTIYFYSNNQSFNVKKFECKLSSSVIKRNHLNPWLMVEFEKPQNLSLHSDLYFDVYRSSLMTGDNFILNLNNNLSPSDEIKYLKIYSLSNMTEKIWKKLFALHSLNGDLRTNWFGDDFAQAIQIVDLITIVVEINTYLIGIENKFINRQMVKVHLNVVEENFANRLDQFSKRYNNKLLNFTIKNLEQTTNLELIDFGKKKINNLNQEIHVSVNSVLEINLDKTNQIDINYSNLFKIVDFDNKTFLVYNSIYVNQSLIFTNFRIYSITLNICSSNVYHFNSFSQECSSIKVYLNMLFDLKLDSVKFSADSIQKTIIKIEDTFYDQYFQILSPNNPLIDLKEQILGSNLIDWTNKRDLKFSIGSDDANNYLIINQNDATIFIRNLISVPSNFSTKILIKKSDLILSSLRINFLRLEVKTNLVKNVTLKNQFDNLLDLDLVKINQSINKNIKFLLRCENLEANLCHKLFRIDQTNLFLTMNKNMAFSNRISCAKIFMQLFLNSNKKINFKILINFLNENSNKLPLIDSNLVHFINSSGTRHKLFVLNKQKLGHEVYIDLERVKNLNTNSLVLALDYKIELDNLENYYIEFPFIYSIEPNQLYSFDFVVKYRINGSVAESFLRQSFYVIRLSSPILFTGPRKYFNSAGSTKFKINLSKFQDSHENKNQLWQTKFLINQLATSEKNLISHGTIDDRSLNLDLNTRNTGPAIFLKLTKFVIDKLSLEIIQVFEYDILIETFDLELKKPSVHYMVNEYFVFVKLFKSDLLAKSTDNPFDFLVYKINSTFNQRNLVEYSIVYNENIPFEIGKYTGELFYLPSEDLYDFDQFHEKIFNFQIEATDLNGKTAQIMVEFVLFDDDPISYFGNAINQIISSRDHIEEKQIVGKVDLKYALEKNIYQNFTKLLNTIDYWKMDFKLLNLDPYFGVDSKTGLISANRFIPIDSRKFYQLKVEINAKFEVKNISIEFYVYIVFQNHRIDRILELKFKNKNYKFISNGSNYQFGLSTTDNSMNMNRRFRLIDQNGFNCRINISSGIVNCVNTNEYKEISFFVIVYNAKNVNNYDLAKVEVKFLNKLSFTDPKSISDENFEFDIEFLPKIGELIVNIFELIKQKDYSQSFDYDQHRIFLIDHHSNSPQFNFYFKLNSASGDLILKNRLLNYKASLSQYVKIVSKSLDNFKIFKLKINFKIEKIVGCLKSLIYSDLKNIDSDLIQIGSGNFYEDQEPVNYYLEKSRQVKSISNDNNLSLSQKVEFISQIESLILVESGSGILYLNRTRLMEKKLIKFDFYVSTFNFDANLNNIQNRQKCTVNLDFEKKLGNILKYFGTNQINIDLLIDLNKITIGETIFNTRDLIFNSNEFFNSKFFLLSDNKVPLKLNEKNGDILLDSNILSKNQHIQFLVKIDFDFQLKIRLLPQVIPREVFFDQNVCYRNSSNTRTNNNFLNLTKSIRKLKLRIDDFNKNRIILRLNDLDSEHELKFEFINNQNGLPKMFSSFLKLNEKTGELSTRADKAKHFRDFCEYYSELPVKILLNVKASSVRNSNKFGYMIINIEPDCSVEFINSKFAEPFYFTKVSNQAKIGDLISKISINLTNYKIVYTVCNDESIVKIDQVTGNIFLNKNLEKKRYQIDICAIVANQMISKPIQIETKLIIVNSDYFSGSNFSLKDFNFNGKRKFRLKIFTDKNDYLKKNLILFEKNQNIKFSTSSPGLFSINSSTGWLKINDFSSSILNRKNYNLKLYSQDSEIYEFKISIEQTILDLFVDRNTKLGSIVLDLKKKFKEIYQFIVLSNQYENFLSYDQTNGLVYLNDFPSSLDGQFFYYAKFASISSDFYILKIRIEFLDTLLSHSISDLNKYVTESYYLINYNLKLFYGNIGIVDNTLRNVYKIESQRCLTNYQQVTNFFFLNQQGQLLVNITNILSSDCDFYELNSRILSHKKIIFKIKIENFFEFKYLKKALIFKEDYYTNLVTDLSKNESHSIQVYDLVKYEKNFKKIFETEITLVSDKNLVQTYVFDSENGLLNLNLRKNVTNGTQMIQFDLIFKKEYLVKKLSLKIFVINEIRHENNLFFDINFSEIDLNEKNTLNILDYYINPISGHKIKTLRNSGIRLFIKNHEPFEFDPLSGVIKVNRNFQLSFDRLVEFSACYIDFCYRKKFMLRFKSNRIEWFDKIKRFYEKFNPKIQIDLNFKKLSPFLFKLKTFGHNLDNFKVNSDNVVIEPGTGLVYLNNQREISDKFYFLISNNSTVLAEFLISFLPKKIISEESEIQLEVFTMKEFSFNSIYLGNLKQKSFECENWSESKFLKTDNQCNLYLTGNNSIQSSLDFKIRVYDPMNLIKSKFLIVKLFVKNFKTDDSKYIIEFKYSKFLDEKTKVDLYKFLYTKFEFILLDIQNYQHIKSLVFLISSPKNFQILKQYKKFISDKFSIELANVYTQNSPYQIIETGSSDQINMINYKNFILNVPNTYEIFLDQDTKFSNFVQFDKLSFQLKKNLNFSVQNYLNFKIWFKIDGENIGQFLFSSIFEQGFMTSEILDRAIRIFIYLSGSKQIIVLPHKIQFSQWYQLQIKLDEDYLFELKKWHSFQHKFCQENSSLKINTNLEARNFFIKELIVGGLPKEFTSFPHVNTYYSDNIRISKFEVNSVEMLQPIIHSFDQIYDKKILKIGQNYKKFLETEQYLFENDLNKTTIISKGLNLSIEFKILNNQNSIYELVKTEKTEIIVDSVKKKVEYYFLNNLIVSIDLKDTQALNKIEIFVRSNLVKFSLNGLIETFKNSQTSQNLDLFKSDLFLSDANDILYQKIFINSKNFNHFYSNSNYNFKIIKKNELKLDGNMSLAENVNSTLKPSLILITIFGSMFIGSLAILSILMLIIAKKRNVRTNINFSQSKFNSRNPLEISVNSSTHNSPASFDSNFTSLERHNDQIVRHPAQQNYFEYDNVLTKSHAVPFFDTLLAMQPSRLSDENCAFSQNDLQQLKILLNWTPDIYQFSSLLNEFEKFSDSNHTCSINSSNNIFNSINSVSTLNNENVLGSINFYEEYDKQTFV